MRETIQLILCVTFWIAIAVVCIWSYNHPDIGSVPQPY